MGSAAAHRPSRSERRRWRRDQPGAPVVVGRARVQAPQKPLYPSIDDWVPILDRNPAAPEPTALPGRVWVGAHGRLIQVRVAHLEFRDEGPESLPGQAHPITTEARTGSRRPAESAWRFWGKELLFIGGDMTIGWWRRRRRRRTPSGMHSPP